ncbi:MAG: DNA topoisomerase VI subunit B [Promethearchaeota archaeon]
MLSLNFNDNTTDVAFQDFREISPAEFLRKNPELAGFDNPGKALYTSFREVFENSLDACEATRVPPDIRVEVEEVRSNEIFRMRIFDNGLGLTAEQINKAFGKALSGTKYGIRQSRGHFGLGGAMSLLWGQITTNKPTHVISKSQFGTEIVEKIMRIDVQRNEAVVEFEATLTEEMMVERAQRLSILDEWQNHQAWTYIEFELEGQWRTSYGKGQGAERKILNYLKDTAVITPYARVRFMPPRPLEGADEIEELLFERVTEEMPPLPKETLPHPHGVDIEEIKRMLADSNARYIRTWLKESFQRLGEAKAKEFLVDINLPDRNLHQKPLTEDEIRMLYREFKNWGERTSDVRRKEKRELRKILHETDQLVDQSGLVVAIDGNSDERIYEILKHMRTKVSKGFTTSISLYLKHNIPQEDEEEEDEKISLLRTVGTPKAGETGKYSFKTKLGRCTLEFTVSKKAGFLPPDGSVLSPVGSELLLQGIQKEYNPEFFTTVSRPPQAYGGHAFIIETGVAYGSKKRKIRHAKRINQEEATEIRNEKEEPTLVLGPTLADEDESNLSEGIPPGLNIRRFANRIPLLYDPKGCIMWKALDEDINLNSYGIRGDHPVLFVSHIASTKIPYGKLGKESVANIPEIRKELALAYRIICRRLGRYIAAEERREKATTRYQEFRKWIPHIAKLTSELSGKDTKPAFDRLLKKERKRLETMKIKGEL